MELKEARYILSIYKNKNISKAAEELYISQPSLSKYLKNIETQLGAKLFDRINNEYIPTYIGERYVHYARKIAEYGYEWMTEFEDITNHDSGRLKIAIPIMLGLSTIQPTLSSFCQQYPNVKINLMEEVNFVAEHTFEDHSIDLILYNVHEYPQNLDYEILDKEEIVMIVSKKNPLSRLGTFKAGFDHPWVNLSEFKDEKFVLLYPDQTTGGVARKLFAEYEMNPDILLSTRNSEMSIRLAIDGIGIAFAPDSYYQSLANIAGTPDSVCFSVGTEKIQTALIAGYMKNRYMPQYVRSYISMIKEYRRSKKASD